MTEPAALERLLDALADFVTADVVAIVHRGFLPRTPVRAVARARERREPVALPAASTRDPLLPGLLAAPAPLVADDVTTSPDVRGSAWLAARRLRSLLVVPIVVDGEPAGVVAAFAEARARFSTADVARVEPFVVAAAAVVDTAWRAEETAGLLEIAKVTSSSRNIREMLREACQRTAILCGGDVAAIWFWDEARRHFIPIFSEHASGERQPALLDRFRRWWEARASAGSEADRDKGFRTLIAERREPIVIDDALSSPLVEPDNARTFGYRSLMAVPLVHDDRLVGFISVTAAAVQAFSAANLRLCDALGGYLAPTVAQWRRFQQTERQLRQAEAQLQIARTLGSTLELKPLLKDIARQAARACGMDRCSVWMYRGKRLVPVMSQFADGRVDRDLWDRFKAIEGRSVESVPVVEEALRTRAPVVVADPAQDSRVPEHVRPFASKCLVALPLLRPDTAVGVLVLENLEQTRPVRPDQINLGMTVSSQIALAIENAGFFEASQRQARELQVLGELRKRVASTLDVASVLDAVADSALRLTGAERCSVYEVDEQDGRLRPRAARGVALGELATLAPGESTVGRAVAGRRLALSPAEPPGRGHPILAVPMTSQAGVLGAIGIEWPAGHEAEPREIRLVEALAESAAIAMENARLFQETQLRLGQNTALLELAGVLSASTELQPLLTEIAQRAARAVGVDRCSVFLRQDGGALVPVMAQYADGHGDPAMWRTFKTIFREHPAGEIRAFADALRLARPVVVDDAGAADLLPAWLTETFAVSNSVVVPLVRKHVAVGVLHFANTGTRRPILASQITLATTIASQIALGIDNVRLYEETQARLRQAEVQAEIARTLDSTLDFRVVLAKIARRAARACDMDRCSIYLWEHERVAPMMSQYADGRADPQLWEAFVGMERQRIMDMPMFAEMMRARGPVMIQDAEHDPRIPAFMDVFRLMAVLCVPLIRQDKIIGAIGLDNTERRRPITAAQVAMATTLASQVALAIDNVRLFDEMQGQRARLAEIFDSTSDGILFVRQDGIVESANRRATEMLGGQTLVDRALAEVVPGADGGRTEGDLVLGGGARVLRWAARPARNAAGEVVGFTLTLRDVTEEREVSQMKSDFVSFVTHQLRTPLSGIRWMLELAQEEGELPPSAAGYVGDAKAASERLIGLVNELLDVARLEQGKLAVHRERVDVPALTRELVEGLRVLVDEKSHALTLTVEDGVHEVVADPQLLRQVLLNLVSNAIKYTPSPGTIGIAIGRRGPTVAWEIRDNGIGIPRESQRRLFEKFFRAENTAALETEGTGLGLYLVRLILEQFGGRVWCESEEGKGSTFTIVLPA